MNSIIESIAGMKVVRLIGKGGMSEVYEVEDVRLGTRHAVKVYSCAKDSPEIRTRFDVEGRLLAKLNHPRIVRVSDYGVDPDSGRPYFVMDIVVDPDGNVKSLADIPAGAADEETIGKWYDDIREGLAYVHGKGVIHRDLKLQNVLIGADGRAVITDFGISRIFNPDGEREAVVDPVQTIVNMCEGNRPVMGSLGYMAPELEMGLPATEKSDWYALGVILYRLLTGTWCDSRTDISDVLSTYDPVWMKLLPGLLHSNPEGRVCLSYAVEREKLIVEEQERLQDEIDMMHSRHKECVGAAEAASVQMQRVFARRFWLYRAAMLAVVIVAVAMGFMVRQQSLALKDLQAQLSTPCFDSLFAIPSSAGAEETDGMPSREDFEHAMLDALALTHETFLDLKNGRISRDKVKSRLHELSVLARNDDMGLFSGLPEGFVNSGGTEALARLLDEAVKKIEGGK